MNLLVTGSNRKTILYSYTFKLLTIYYFRAFHVLFKNIIHKWSYFMLVIENELRIELAFL